LKLGVDLGKKSGAIVFLTATVVDDASVIITISITKNVTACSIAGTEMRISWHESHQIRPNQLNAVTRTKPNQSVLLKN